MTKKINLAFIVLILIFLLNIYRNVLEKNLNFWTLEQNHSTIGLRKFSDNRELLAGEVIIGNFLAKYDNLGQVAFWFNTYNRVNKDRLIFRIKDIGEDGWLYEKTISTEDLPQDKIYPFQFPIVEKSRGREFQFELESLEGATGSAIYVSNLHSTPAIRYLFTDKLVKAEKNNYLFFFLQKITYYLEDQEIFFSAVALLILIFYRLVLLRIQSFYLTSFVLSIAIIYAIFKLQSESSQIVSFTLFILWTISNMFHKVSPTVSIFNAMALLFFAVISFIFGIKPLSENFAIWALLFILSAAIIQNFQLHYQAEINFKRFWGSFIDYFRLSVRFIYEGSMTIAAAGRKTYEIYIVFANNNISKANALTMAERHLVLKISGKTYKIYQRFSIFLPYIIFSGISATVIYSLLLVSKSVISYINLYLNYFPIDQLKIFFGKTGIILSMWYLIATVIFFFVLQRISINYQKSSYLRHKLLLFVIFLYLTRLGGDAIFDKTTMSFRNEVLIWGITPSKTQEPWVDVTIRGVNFKDSPFRGVVKVNGIDHRVILWSNKEVVFRTDPSSTKTGVVQIENIDGKTSNAVSFIYLQ